MTVPAKELTMEEVVDLESKLLRIPQSFSLAIDETRAIIDLPPIKAHRNEYPGAATPGAGR